MVLAPAAPPPIQSWADAEHGWKAAGPGVEATDDGGRHWRVVFRYGNGGAAEVVSLLRTSPTAGIVGLEYGGFVTNDAGRHWYLLSENTPGGVLLGHGSLLFGAEDTDIVQATSWPPRTLRCRGKWFHQIAGGLNAYGPKPRTICLEGPGISIPTRSVYKLPQPATDGSWGLFGQALIPGRPDRLRLQRRSRAARDHPHRRARLSQRRRDDPPGPGRGELARTRQLAAHRARRRERHLDVRRRRRHVDERYRLSLIRTPAQMPAIAPMMPKRNDSIESELAPQTTGT